MFREDPRELRPRLCPSCGTLVGSTATKCHECGTSMTFSLAAVSKALGSLLPETSPVTYVIVFINGLLFVLSLILSMKGGEGASLMGGIDGMVLRRLGARVTPLIFEGEVWRLVTPIFLHGSVMHFGMNTLVLMDVGPQLEEVYGSARYLFLYVVMGIFSFVVSSLWNPYVISIGASGSLLGLIGLMLAITKKHGGALAEMYRKQLIRWVVYIFVFGFIIRGVDNAAHLGGLVAGYGLGKMFDDREPMNAQERSRAYLLGWTAALVVGVSFVMMVLQFFRTAQPVG